MDPRNRLLLTKRLAWLQFLAWIMLALLALAYGWTQLVRRRELQALAQRQAVKVRTTPAPRGIIFDRNGHKLVDNLRALHLVIQHEDLPTDRSAIAALATEVGLEPDTLARRIQVTRNAGSNRMVVLSDNLDEAGVAQAEVLRARYPFLSIQVAPRRVYLGDELAGHVAGYVGEVTPERLAAEPNRFQMGEIVGRTGFEASANDRLKGLDGRRRILVDHLGREVALYGLQEAQAGRSVFLTLDAGLQQVLQQAFGEERGAGVVLDLRDGGILAMYSSPSYDPNIFLNRLSQEVVDQYIRNPIKPMLNRATQGLYPPGSTFKLLTALAALDKGILTPDTVFTCHGKKDFYGRTFRCDGVHGTVNLVQAIAHSCNVFFYELGSRLDIDEIHAAAVKYGLTELTGVDLPHEVPCRIPSREWKKLTRKEKWYAGETISVAIGQGSVGLTPLGLARFYGVLGTRGKILTPHLFYGTRHESTGELELAPPPPPRDAGLSPETWAQLDEGLAQVVRVGTAQNSAMAGITLVGKTGTSQVTTFVDRKHYATLSKNLKDNALFAGYAPRENPQIAFAIVVENAGFGAHSAAPIARTLCQYWFLDRPRKPLPPPRGRIVDTFLLEARERAGEGQAGEP